VNNFRERKSYFILFLAISLFAAGCSEENAAGFGEIKDITAEAALKIYRACQYTNGNFCEDECCRAAEKCNGEIAYRECDLEAGEWKNGVFSDSDCSSACEADIDNEDNKIENKLELNQKKCIEGWKCISKSERSYRNLDCSFGETQRCNSGCMNDTCIRSCNPGNFSCRKDALQICDDNGEGWKFYMNCAYGCENSTCIQAAQSNQTQNTTQPSQKECSSACFSVTNFHYDAEGNDNNNLNDEYVTIKNSCSFSCDLSGWEISDAASHKYSISNFILADRNEFTLYSGDGAGSASQLYWKRKQAVWNNNDGDTLYLKNQDGELIFSQSYS